MSATASAARPRPKPELTSRSWLALAFVTVFAYLDWITHREIATTVVLAGAAAGLIAYRRAVVDFLNLGPTFATMSPRLKPVLAAIPGVAYFLIRGQGTSGAGGLVLVSMLTVIGANVVFGPQLDVRLAAFYGTRNRVLARPLRMALAVVAPILLAFLVVHGSLADLPALFGGTTKRPMTPVGRESRFLLATLLSAAVSWLLLREAPGGWEATHAVPATGIATWTAPGDAQPSGQLRAGTPVRVVERTGEWARVQAADLSTAWVDGRLLVDRSRA